MEIKVTNFSLADHFGVSTSGGLEFIYPALQEFKKLKAPVNVAYNTIKSIGVIEKFIKDYEDTRLSICSSLCEKDAEDKPIIENNRYKFTDENKIEFDKKWQELLNSEVTLDIWPINQSDISGIKEINMTCYETLMKYGFIKDDSK